MDYITRAVLRSSTHKRERGANAQEWTETHEMGQERTPEQAAENGLKSSSQISKIVPGN